MKKLTAILLAIAALAVLVSCASDQNPSKPADSTVPETQQSFDVTTKDKVNIRIELADGRVMEAELYPDIAPITVQNFVDLCTSGYYDGLIFHRIINDFMIQGGKGAETATIKGEFSANGVQNDLKHTKGVLSMARVSGQNDSASSQFFIVSAKSYPSLDGQYAAFGKLTSGFDVLAQLQTVATDSNDQPLEDVTIKYIRVTD